MEAGRPSIWKLSRKEVMERWGYTLEVAVFGLLSTLLWHMEKAFNHRLFLTLRPGTKFMKPFTEMWITVGGHGTGNITNLYFQNKILLIV